MRKAIRSQLFARMPTAYRADFRAFLFSINIPRFAVQSFVLVVIDSVSLLFYLGYHTRTGVPYPWHIVVHIIKIACMVTGFFFYSVLQNMEYDEKNRFLVNADFVYPLFHFISEVALFVSGPEDFSALIRFLAVPFIVAGIPVVRQLRAFLLSTLVFVFYSLYLPHTAYASTLTAGGAALNLWLVVFLCVNLVAFTVYSIFVKNYTAMRREENAQASLIAANEKLDTLSRRDGLTGLRNRRDLKLFMESTWKVPGSTRKTVSVLMFDIDYFKRYNDRFGHLVGDECLVRVTSAIREELGEEEDIILARFGGEEFIAVTYDKDHDELLAIARRIRLRVELLKIENPDSDVSPYLTICIGLATQNVAKLNDYNAIFEWADECLYFAKQSGRNQVVQTAFERGRFLDASGRPLGARPAPSRTPSFDSALLETAVNDIGAGCSYLYYAANDNLIFSE
ncbi:GGDEF domain-containing protein, partial [Oscillospiraceae bacterium OttesenSCG-928-G22]|nr:GGDEF domain-containing protein [Oscillospiraceae bacterium OttesenSCG-928-G22]